jgi:hypothetical protein
MNRILWVIAAFLGIVIGLYPLIYVFGGGESGLLSAKPDQLLDSTPWNVAFYGHIIFGGISLLIGWVQFRSSWRRRFRRLHETIGMIYLICVSLSGICSLFLAVNAEGGLPARSGFFLLGLAWLFTTYSAYIFLLRGNYMNHGNWMVRSYAVTFAAVMLRIWLPLFGTVLQMPFEEAYPIIAWLCWVPNLFVAEWIVIRRNKLNRSLSVS